MELLIQSTFHQTFQKNCLWINICLLYCEWRILFFKKKFMRFRDGIKTMWNKFLLNGMKIKSSYQPNFSALRRQYHHEEFWKWNFFGNHQNCIYSVKTYKTKYWGIFIFLDQSQYFSLHSSVCGKVEFN